MTHGTATARQDFSYIGEKLPAVRSGRVTVTLQWVRLGVYRVETSYGSTGGAVIDEWSYPYGDEDLARREARRVVRVFAPTVEHEDGPTVEQVAARWDELDEEVEEARRRRQYARMADAEERRDAVAPLTLCAVRAMLAVDVKNHLRNAA